MPDMFRRSIARIVAGRRQAVGLAPRPDVPESFGWLRRPDLDEADGEAWELPDGEIRLTRRALGRAKGRRRPGERG